MSFGPKDASGLIRIPSVSAVQQAPRHTERTIYMCSQGSGREAETRINQETVVQWGTGLKEQGLPY